MAVISTPRPPQAAAPSSTQPAADDSNNARRGLRKTLEERIAEAHELLKSLEMEKRKRDAEQRALNEKAVRRLLATEGLLAVDIETWRRAIQPVKAALGR